MKTPAIITSAILFMLLMAGGAFWGGMSVGKAQAQNEQTPKNPSFVGQSANPNNPAGGPVFSVPGGPGPASGPFLIGGAGGTAGPGNPGVPAGPPGASGTIIRVEGNTITMTGDQGQTFTVTLSSNIPIVKNVFGSKSDLVPGAHIFAQGNRSGDNVAARRIQLTDQPDAINRGVRGPGVTPTPMK